MEAQRGSSVDLHLTMIATWQGDALGLSGVEGVDVELVLVCIVRTLLHVLVVTRVCV